MQIQHISTGDILVGERLRDASPEAVKDLQESIKKIGGLIQPISLRPAPEAKGKYELVTGLHRLRAYEALGYATIPALVKQGMTAEQAELREISENLHRNDLTELERSEQLARWIEIAGGAPEQDFMGEADKSEDAPKRKPKAISSKGGKGKKGGLNEAARTLPGVTRSGAQRSVKVAGLTKEAKAEAKALKLDDNQQALLAASKATGADAQVAKLKELAAAKVAAAETKKAEKAKAATETPAEAHAREASKYVDKVVTAVQDKIAKLALTKADVESLIEHLQSVAEKCPKDRGNLVRKIEAAKLTTKPAAAAE